MSLSKLFPLVTAKLNTLEGFTESLPGKDCLPFVNELRVRYNLQPVAATADVIDTLYELTEAIAKEERYLISTP